MNKGIVILFGIVLLIVSYYMYAELEVFDVVTLDDKKGAKCLDGSNYSFYIQKGFGDGKNNFILFFDGGGWCSTKVYNSTLESCFRRTKTYLGSSDVTMNQKVYNFFGKIFLVKRLMKFVSKDKNINPTFYNWNKIILNYCDGRGFVGFNNDPIEHKKKNLYFRGFNNTLAVLDYIKTNFNFNQTEKVIVSGSSAGGHASLHYSNYISNYFPQKTKVKTISDSGFFLDVNNEDKPWYNFGGIWKDLIQFTSPNFDISIKKDCKYNKESWKCLMPEYFYDTIKIPVFIIHSQYDSYALCHLIGTCNLTFSGKEFFNSTRQIDEVNRKRLLKVFDDIKKKHPDWGVFSPSCKLHDFLIYSISFDNPNVMVRNDTVKTAISKWMEDKNSKKQNDYFYVDPEAFTSQAKCGNIKDPLYYIQYFGILSDIF